MLPLLRGVIGGCWEIKGSTDRLHPEPIPVDIDELDERYSLKASSFAK
jgi:hypothetical protein